MPERSTLSLRAAATATAHGSGDRVPREYLDFVVDGKQLREVVLRRIGEGAETNDYASLLVTNWPVDLLAEDISMLLGETASSLADRRVPLYVCAECDGLGCGTVTAVIDHTDDTVTWRDFGWQTDYDPFIDTEPFTDVGPFLFSRTEYEEAIRAAASERR
jgi:hypothetical protein